MAQRTYMKWSRGGKDDGIDNGLDISKVTMDSAFHW